MGIKGLRDLMKKEFSKKNVCFEKTVPIDTMSGKRLVVDTSIYIYTFKATHQDRFLECFKCMIHMCEQYNIELVFVFDGISPEEKCREKMRRVKQRQDQKKRVEELINDLSIYKNSGVVSEKLQLMHDKFVTTNRSNVITFTNFNHVVAQKCIEKQQNNIVEISTHDINSLKILLTEKNIKYITAQGEAEAACSAIVTQKLAHAVITKDSDAFACGASIVITNINLSKHEVSVVTIEEILSVFELDYTSWLDLCIMCGTDFNDNIYKIGPVRALQYIKKYKTLEHVPLDTTILNYVTVRTFFTQTIDYSSSFETAVQDHAVEVVQDQDENITKERRLVFPNRLKSKAGAPSLTLRTLSLSDEDSDEDEEDEDKTNTQDEDKTNTQDEDKTSKKTKPLSNLDGVIGL